MPINTFFSDDELSPENTKAKNNAFFGAEETAAEEDIFASIEPLDMPNADEPDKSDIGSSIFDNLVGDGESQSGMFDAPASSASEETMQFDINEFDAMPLFDTATNIDISSAPSPTFEEPTASDDKAEEVPDVPAFMENPAKPEPPKPILFDFEKEFSEADAEAAKNAPSSSQPAPLDLSSSDDLYAKPAKDAAGFDFDAFERENFSDAATGVAQLKKSEKAEAAAPADTSSNEPILNETYSSKRQYKPVFTGPISNPVTETKESRIKAAAAKKAAAAAALAGLEVEQPAVSAPQPQTPVQPQAEFGVPVLESPVDTPITAPVTDGTVTPASLDTTDVYPAGSDAFSFTGGDIGIDTSLFDGNASAGDYTQPAYTDYTGQDFFDGTDADTVANVAAGVAGAMGVAGGDYSQPDADATRVFDNSATRVFDANDLNNYAAQQPQQPAAPVQDYAQQPQEIGFETADFAAQGGQGGFEQANDFGTEPQYGGSDFNRQEYGAPNFETMDFGTTSGININANNFEGAEDVDYTAASYDETPAEQDGYSSQATPSFNPFESSDWTGGDDTGDVAAPSPRARSFSGGGDDDDYSSSSPQRVRKKKSAKTAKKSNTPLIVLLAVLVAAIIGIVLYAIFGGRGGAASSSSSAASISQSVATDPSASLAGEGAASSVPPVVAEPVAEPIPRDAWYMVLANSSNLLPATYSVSLGATEYGGEVDSRIVGAVNSMLSAAAADGINLLVHTGYRSYETQAGLYAANPATAAPAGGSDYNTGLSVGLYVSGGDRYDDNFDSTAAGQWLATHAADYGFIQRYPSGGEESTGISYMPWQYRYVGVAEALRIKQSGLTLEQYLAQDNPTGVPENESPDDGSLIAATPAADAAVNAAPVDDTGAVG